MSLIQNVSVHSRIKLAWLVCTVMSFPGQPAALFQKRWQFVKMSPESQWFTMWHMWHGCAASKPPKGRFVQRCTGWNDEQKWPRMQDCHLKIARDWRDSFRLVSDWNTYWLGRRTKKLHEGIQTFTHFWAHYGNDIHLTVSPIVPNPVWTWPLTLPPSLNPCWFRGPAKAHMLCVRMLRLYSNDTRRALMSPG